MLMAIATACDRVCARSFCIALWTWDFTVSGETVSRPAISSVRSPVATRPRISRSRRVSERIGPARSSPPRLAQTVCPQSRSDSLAEVGDAELMPALLAGSDPALRRTSIARWSLSSASGRCQPSSSSGVRPKIAQARLVGEHHPVVGSR